MKGSSAQRMVGDLARQLAHLPDEEAATRIVDHVRSFWDPRLRIELISEVLEGRRPADPVVTRVADLLRDG